MRSGAPLLGLAKYIYYRLMTEIGENRQAKLAASNRYYRFFMILTIFNGK